MLFSNDDLALFANTKEVRIETTSDDGAVHRTIIWVVVDGEEPFIRSYRGASARWYREALANSEVAIHVDKKRIPARAVSATDPESIARTTAGLEEKYRGDPATKAMVRPEVLDTTLRLDPI
jgi:hypothetical protein